MHTEDTLVQDEYDFLRSQIATLENGQGNLEYSGYERPQPLVGEIAPNNITNAVLLIVNFDDIIDKINADRQKRRILT